MKIFITMLLIIGLFNGCGSNNSSYVSIITDNNSSSDGNEQVTVDNNVSIAFTNGNTKTLTTNSEVYTVEVAVFGPNNAPYNSGKVKIAYPDKVKTGVDVGYFTSSEVNVVDGKARFNYVGPRDLQARIDANDTSTTFGFYHEENPTDIKNFTFRYSPTPNQVVLTSYNLKETSSQGNTIGLNSSAQLSFYIEDSNGQKLQDSNMNSLNITLLNPNLADIRDTTGRVGDLLSFTNKNDITISFLSNTISGIVPIKVDASFKDVNNQNQTLSKTFNMVILSGPPTAMSISYVGTSQDSQNAKFVENLVVTVTDKYFNRVNTQPAISVALIAGYKRDHNSSNARLYFAPGGTSTATLDPTNDTLSVNGDIDLSNVNPATDIVATFGNGYTYQASGKWDILSLSGTNTLNLADNFEANSSVSNLGYAIGNNYRQDTCREGSEWVGFASVDSNTSTLDTNGMAHIHIDYDYYLTGKDVVLTINLLGRDANSQIMTKLGEAKKITLRGNGFEAATASVPAGASNYTVNIPIKISNTGEWLRNANFRANISYSSNLSVVSGPTFHSNIGTCTNGGVSYISVTVRENNGEAGTITVNDIIIANEF